MNEKELQNKDEMDLDDSRVYELAYHVVPTLDEAGLSAQVDAIRARIEKTGGTILSEQWPQTMQLAYPLSRTISRTHQTFQRASFGWIVFEAMPKVAHAIKEALRADEQIIRFFVVKTVRDAEPVRHPAQASHTEARPAEEALERTPEAKMKAEEKAEPAVPMSKEEMDAEIEKLIVK
jgi:ribosomal protein S6